MDFIICQFAYHKTTKNKKIKMKKITLLSMIVLSSLNFIPTISNAKSANLVEETSNAKEVPAEVTVMLNRLEEIKEMDKSNLNSAERKELRSEVTTINQSLRSSGNGVYISVGALIIIILLLIIIF